MTESNTPSLGTSLTRRNPQRECSMKERMKILLAIFAAALATGVTHGQTNSYSYDWKAHEEQIDALFLKHAPEILKGEREKIEAILPKDKADQYMKKFEEGLRSETGFIMIEFGQNRWLEIAYREGYAQKALFRRGYFSGLAQEAEKEK